MTNVKVVQQTGQKQYGPAIATGDIKIDHEVTATLTQEKFFRKI